MPGGGLIQPLKLLSGHIRLHTEILFIEQCHRVVLVFNAFAGALGVDLLPNA